MTYDFLVVRSNIRLKTYQRLMMIQCGRHISLGCCSAKYLVFAGSRGGLRRGGYYCATTGRDLYDGFRLFCLKMAYEILIGVVIVAQVIK